MQHRKRSHSIALAAALVLLVSLVVGLWWSVEGPLEQAGSSTENAGGRHTQTPLLGTDGKSETPWFRERKSEEPPEAAGTLRLEGQVVDSGEAGVGGAFVDLVGPGGGRRATSDDDGSFSFDALPPGPFVLSARKDNLVAAPLAQELSPESPPVVLRMVEGGSVRVEVVTKTDRQPLQGADVTTDQGHQERTDNAGLATLAGVQGSLRVWIRAPGFASLSTMVEVPTGEAAKEPILLVMIRGAKLSGRVVDEDGQPVPGARVVSRNPLELFDEANAADVVRTDEQGGFQYAVVPAGTYQFLATHPDFAPGGSDTVKTDGVTPIDVTITMDAGGTIRGQVVDESGKPAPGTLVEAHADAGKAAASNSHRTVTDESGAFELRGIPRDSVWVAATNDIQSTDPVSVDLAGSANVSDLKLRFTGSHQIAGQVVDAGGEPVADVRVIAFADGTETVAPFRQTSGSAITDGGGGFTIKGLARGEFRVGVERAPGDLRGAVNVASGTTDVQLVVAGDGAVSGHVSFTGNEPLEQFSVELNTPPGKSFPGEGGVFQLSGVAPGTYDLIVRGRQFAPTTVRDVTVTAGQNTDVRDIALTTGRTLRGRVIDSDGRPVSGANVVSGLEIFGDGAGVTARAMSAAQQQQLGLRIARTDANGEFRIESAGADELMLVAEHQSGRSQPQRVRSGADDQSFELTLEGFGVLTGRVLLSDGRPAKGVRVVAARDGAKEHTANVMTDERGQFRFQRLALGPTTVSAVQERARTSQVVSNSTTVTQSPGELELILEQGSVSVSVHVEGDAGAFAHAEIFLFSSPVSARNAAEIEHAMERPGSGQRMGVARPGVPAVFSGLSEGAVTICATALAGNVRDPRLIHRARVHRDRVAAVCQGLDLAPGEQVVRLRPTPTALASLPR